MLRSASVGTLRTAALLALAATLAPASAPALEDELSFSAGPAVTTVPVADGEGRTGYGATAGLAHGLSDEWALALDASFTRHGEGDGESAFGLASISPGLRYAIDILVLVPYLVVAGAWHPVRPAGDATAAYGVQWGLGVDWRRWPGWALGVEGRQESFIGVSDQSGGTLSLCLRISRILAL